MVLFARGEGLLMALSGGDGDDVAALRLRGAAAVAPAGMGHADPAAGLLAVAVSARPSLLLLAGLACLVLALPQAHVAAPERNSHTRLTFLPARLPPTLALALAYLALLVRGQRALLLRSVLLTLLAVGISYLAIANNRVVSAESQATAGNRHAVGAAPAQRCAA